jgi:hypothetical protein
VRVILNTPPTPRYQMVYFKDITSSPDISNSKPLRQVKVRDKLRLQGNRAFREPEMDSEIWLGENLRFRVEDDWLEGPDVNMQELFDQDPEEMYRRIR